MKMDTQKNLSIDKFFFSFFLLIIISLIHAFIIKIPNITNIKYTTIETVNLGFI